MKKLQIKLGITALLLLVVLSVNYLIKEGCIKPNHNWEIMKYIIIPIAAVPFLVTVARITKMENDEKKDKEIKT